MELSRRRLLASAALALAACSGDRVLRRPGASGAARGTSDPGRAAFLEAVRRGDLPRVRTLLAADGALAAATDERGRSAFVLAHLGGHRAVAALLREQGLELDVVEAVLAEDWERVEALAAADPACMNALHPIGGTPLHAGALAGSLELYRLRSLDCDPEARFDEGSGFTAARAALEGPDPLGAFLAATDLLGNRSDPNAPQKGGDSCLHGAVRRKDARLVRLVVRKGGDVAARDTRGRTARDLALELGWDEGVRLLAQHATIARDHRASRFAFDASRSPVVVPDLTDVPQEMQSRVTGSSHSQFEEVQGLLAEDPRRVFSISTDGELAIEACGHTGRRDIIRLHLDHGSPLSLPNAVSLGDVGHVRFLLEHDPLLIHERGPHDFPPMWYPAIGRGSVELAELLLDAGCPLDQESLGSTALHWAALRDDVELVRYLAERGADLDAVGYKFDRAGQTPLELALARDRAEVAAALRELGARAS